jgi:hypothetical protein
VQRHALAVVESEAKRPVLPLDQVAVDREAGAVGLHYVERFECRALGEVANALGDQVRGVLAHDLRSRSDEAVLDLEQFHCVHVDHAVQAIDRAGVGVRAGNRLDPGVAPAEAAARVFLGDNRAAIGPRVHEDKRHVGDAPLCKSRDDIRMLAQNSVCLLPFIDREVGLHVGDVLPVDQGVGRQ